MWCMADWEYTSKAGSPLELRNKLSKIGNTPADSTESIGGLFAETK